jgi:hypothetical protein
MWGTIAFLILRRAGREPLNPRAPRTERRQAGRTRVD